MWYFSVRMNLATIAAKRILPDFGSRLRVRRLLNMPLDAYDWITGQRDPLMPPRGLWFVGGRKDCKLNNEEFLGHFRRAGLRPEDAMLDIGCGIGVMAARLATFLTTGSYEGFDIVKVGIDWATKHITSKHPNFHFQHADIYNRHYNPRGKIRGDAFPFPYSDRQFDFAFARSVFTHMLGPGVQRYLQETARVLKTTGTAVVTAFLINDESASLIQGGKSSLLLAPAGQHWVLDPGFPETAVGLPERDFLAWCEQAGLEAKRIDYGSWCGRSTFLSYQDLITLQVR
jgi:SAM-dependent methyltransferase